MKNSPLIRVKDLDGDNLNINANYVVMFFSKNDKVQVHLSDDSVQILDCTERSFRSYMNKALGVSKKEDEEA